MNKILLVDDHPIVLLALRRLLEKNGYEIVGEAENGVDALNLARQLKPDLVVLDIMVPQLDSMEMLKRLQIYEPTMRVLVLSAHEPAVVAKRCQMAKASGFVWKQQDLTEVVDAVKAVLSGYIYFPQLDVRGAKSHPENSEAELVKTLTNQEIVVLRALVKGMPIKEIAESMLLSANTVSTYKTRILKKLNISSMFALCEFAKRNNLTDMA